MRCDELVHKLLHNGYPSQICDPFNWNKSKKENDSMINDLFCFKLSVIGDDLELVQVID